MKKLFMTVSVMLVALGCMSQNIRYVKPGGTGDGSSWQLASGDIQAMVSLSSLNDQVWVAKGTYLLSSTLQMKTGVNVYGGFAGTETSLTQRDWVLNETTLDGNSSVVVLYQTSTPADTIETAWDGFTLQNGISDHNNAGAGAHLEKGGTIINCKVINNHAVDFGGGIYTREGAMIKNCTISGNSANNGGGVFLANGGKVINCSITNNTGAFGGGAVTYGGGEIVNCIITGNSGSNGGGIYQGGGGTVVNCVVAGNNSSSLGGGIWSAYSQYGGPPSAVINTIFWNNTSTGSDPQVSFFSTDNYAITNFSHCAIQDISSITWDYIINNYNINLSSGNNDANGPNFTNPTTNDYTLTSASPCINLGDNSYALPYSLDISGNARIQKGRVDLGANESTFGTTSTGFQKYFVTLGGDDANNGSSWTLGKKTVQAAINSAAESILPGSPVEIWVAKGTYSLSTPVEMKENINIYGGFTGNETSLDERDWVNNVTVLDANPGSGTRRSLIQYADFYNSSSCDGFSLINGNELGKGGAALLRNNGLLNHCIVENNTAGLRGGGIYLLTGSRVQNCTIQNNKADQGGGAYLYYGGELINCTLAADSAWMGGGVTTENGGSIRNCLFTDNISGYAGAGASLSLGGEAINCTFSKNHSYQIAGGLYGEYIDAMQGIGVKIGNSIFWNNFGDSSDPQLNFNGGNAHISFVNNAVEDISSVEFGPTVINNDINLANSNTASNGPNFNNPDNNDFTLTELSPCINKGDNTLVVDSLDRGGDIRIQGGYVDMGAFESPFVTGIPIYTTRSADAGLFPNPVIDQATLVIKGYEGWGKVSVIDARGMTVKDFELSIRENSTKSFDFSDLPAGNYYMKIMGNDLSKTLKFIKH